MENVNQNHQNFIISNQNLQFTLELDILKDLIVTQHIIEIY